MRQDNIILGYSEDKPYLLESQFYFRLPDKLYFKGRIFSIGYFKLLKSMRDMDMNGVLGDADEQVKINIELKRALRESEVCDFKEQKDLIALYLQGIDNVLFVGVDKQDVISLSSNISKERVKYVVTNKNYVIPGFKKCKLDASIKSECVILGNNIDVEYINHLESQNISYYYLYF